MTALDSSCAEQDAFYLMEVLERVSGVKIPKVIEGISNKMVLHKTICRKRKYQNICGRTFAVKIKIISKK